MSDILSAEQYKPESRTDETAVVFSRLEPLASTFPPRHHTATNAVSLATIAAADIATTTASTTTTSVAAAAATATTTLYCVHY